MAHSTALSSSTLMCSLWPLHFHPHTVDHFHKFAGILALSLWYFSVSSEAEFTSMSSPLILTKLSSFLTRRSLPPWMRAFLGPFIGCLVRKVAKSVLAPGDVRSMQCWTVSWGLTPSHAPNWLRSHVITVTFQELPSSVNLRSWSTWGLGAP